MKKLYCTGNPDPESTKERLEKWQWWDRIGYRQGDIELEWTYPPDTKSCVHLNRIFLNWCQNPVYFFIPGRSGLCSVNGTLPLSERILKKLGEELSPFKLMIKSGQNKEIPKHIKKKIKQIVTKSGN